MNIVLIDDDPNALCITKLLLNRLGHVVYDYQDPRKALDEMVDPLPPVDLVMTDVQMEPMDGFEVAERVADARGTTPPMVLLVSGYPAVEERLREVPPSRVIGLLPKPFDINILGRVLSLLDESRTRCPGLINAFCPRDRRAETPTAEDEASWPCRSPAYSQCPHYDASCGQTLRLWISTAGLIS